jgi:broad specificity phosphatase PhoE
MKRIYLIRHGETESNRKGVFRGRLDIPLSQNGREQAVDLRRYFENIPVDVVYTSPLQRAVETAETVFPGHIPVKEKWLNNLDLGKWSGMEKNYYWRFHLDNASVSLIILDRKRFTLVKLNDTHHLKQTVMEWY